MTFVRTKTIKGHSYYYLQKSVRKGKDVISVHVAYLGKRGGGLPLDVIKTERYTKTDIKKVREITTKSKRLVFQNLDTKHEIKAYDRLYSRGFDTKEKFFDTETNKYKQGRAKLHKKILKEIDNKKARPSKGKKPTVILVGGISGSGKTSVLQKQLNLKKFVILNNDDIKGKLPEYRGINANMLHEESSDVFDKALEIHVRKRNNILIDATLKNTEKAKRQISLLRKLGYRIELVATNLSGDEAVKRAAKRFLKKKRYVPLEYIGQNAEQINKSAFILAPLVDEFAIYSSDVARNRKPILLTKGVNKIEKKGEIN